MKFLLNYIRTAKHDRAVHRRLVAVLCVLSLLVAAGVTWELRLPGITLSSDPVCGIAEHTHDLECRGGVLNCTAVPGHTHDYEDCYDQERNLTCGIADYLVHTHTERCCDGEGNRVCTLPQIIVHTHNDNCYVTEEHVHEDSCYTWITGETLICATPEQEPHTHGEGCYDLLCDLEELEPHTHSIECYFRSETALCGQEEGDDHQHSEVCFRDTAQLECQLTEREGHLHGEDCYELACTLTEKGHAHSDACYEQVRGELICTADQEPAEPKLVCQLPEVELHVHDEDKCYERPLTCESDHTHNDDCYGEPELICTKLETYEHIHTEACFTFPAQIPCTQQEHHHSESCLPQPEIVETPVQQEPTALCGVEAHTHGDGCYQVISEGHTHSDSCYEWVMPEKTSCMLIEEEGHTHDNSCTPMLQGDLICGLAEEAPQRELTCTLQEHSHTDSCYVEPEKPKTLVYLGNGCTITITYDSAAALPEDVTLSVREIQADSEEYGRCLAEAAYALKGEAIQQARFFDITFRSQGQEVEPAAPVQIEITNHQAQAVTAQEEIKAVHFAEDGVEVLEAQAEQNETGLLGLTYSQDAFSISGYVTTVPAGTTTAPEAEATDTLPVDYYIYLDNRWALVGSTDKGWLAAAEGETDKVALKDIASVLGSYGFQAGTADPLTLAIQSRAEGQTLLTSELAEQTLKLTRSDQGYNLYYLPNNQTPIAGATLAEVDGGANAFYSVTVLDPDQLVYADASEIPSRMILPKGSLVELMVRSNSDVQWTVSGVEAQTQQLSFGTVSATAEDGTESQQEVSTTLIHIASLENTAQVLAVDANPTFTVQYYANLNIGSSEDYSNNDNYWETKLIDTRNGGTGSGGKMPVNGTANTVTNLYVDKATGRFPLAMSVQTAFFKDKQFEYLSAPGMKFVNQLADNSNYSLVAVWVLKEGSSSTSIAEADFDIYTNVTELGFTTDPDSADLAAGKAILIEEGTVIRLVFDPVAGSYSNSATFYDYDISDGYFYSNSTYTSKLSTQPAYNARIVYANTNRQGINSASNYSGTTGLLGFGNNNTNSGMADFTFQGQYLNKYNLNNPNSDEHGCTYGLVTGLNADGTLIYASGVSAPKLFNEAGAVVGKTTHPGYSLNFYRNGDTYTLQSVTNASGTAVTGDLTKLQLYSNVNGSAGNNPSNNFWPMDSVDYWKANGGMSPGHDLAFGEDTKYSSGGSSVAGAYRRWGSGIWNALPIADDGQDHNSYFGMNFSLNFSLTQDYIGPLEYAFYGDDDLWIFLTYPDGTTKLICDIGGVHTSMGEYVDLWDWIKQGDASAEGLYTLSGFYTERGASGSTCWMNFTLPSVSSVNLEESTGDLQISKTTQNADQEEIDLHDLFQFQVDLKYSENGEALGSQYRYPVVITRADGKIEHSTISTGGTVSLYTGDTALIKGLPVGTYYSITELTRAGYSTLINNQNGYIASGLITAGAPKEANFINVPGAVMPATGGIGLLPYALGGLLTAASALLYQRNNGRKQRRGGRRTRQ